MWMFVPAGLIKGASCCSFFLFSSFFFYRTRKIAFDSQLVNNRDKSSRVTR